MTKFLSSNIVGHAFQRNVWIQGRTKLLKIATKLSETKAQWRREGTANSVSIQSGDTPDSRVNLPLQESTIMNNHEMVTAWVKKQNAISQTSVVCYETQVSNHQSLKKQNRKHFSSFFFLLTILSPHSLHQRSIYVYTKLKLILIFHY